MHRAGGQITDLANAFEIANVEMLIVALPEVEVVACTRAALARWNCRQEDVLGKKLAKYGAGAISARYTTDDTTGAQKVEVAFTPPLGQARTSHFSPQSWQTDGREYMILIGQHGSQAEAETAIQNERRLQLALRSGGYALWDYDYRSRLTTSAPEIYEMLGFEEGAVDLDFVNFNARIHPDDLDKTLDEKIRNAPFGADLFQTKYRVRARNGSYIWIEAVAGLVRDPVDGKPAKVVGLCRNIQNEMTALETPVDIELIPGFRELPPAVEDGATFEENAVRKALHYGRLVEGLLFADDSGLEVDALGGAPGVYSARYSGPHATDEANNRLLLENLRGVADRTARFVCAIALVEGGRLRGVYPGAVEGRIIDDARGARGFGYDPLFFYPPYNCTFGEADDAQKFAVSHRGQALRAMLTSI